MGWIYEDPQIKGEGRERQYGGGEKRSSPCGVKLRKSN
jgi:hypothetical protein